MKNLHFGDPTETLETLRLATEAAGIGVWDRNLLTGELHLSDRCRRILGFTQDVTPTFELIVEQAHPEDRQSLQEAVQKALNPENGGEYACEYRICWPNRETRWVAANGKCFFDEVEGERKAVRLVGTLHDRTEQKLAQHALLQAEKLAVTGRLAASIAHEINNPLEAVTNLLYLLRNEEDSRQRELYLGLAESELARVVQVATNTLRFYRDPIGITEVDIVDLIQSVLSIFQGRLTTSGIQMNLALAEGTRVRTAAGELRQVIVNLVSNALDAMPKGGRLMIRCRTSPKRQERPFPRVSICVADTGHGMSPEVLRQSFEPFYTTKGNLGTGLGLWLSTELLRKHGCQLQVKSKPSKGTVFAVHVPLASPHEIDTHAA